MACSFLTHTVHRASLVNCALAVTAKSPQACSRPIIADPDRCRLAPMERQGSALSRAALLPRPLSRGLHAMIPPLGVHHHHSMTTPGRMDWQAWRGARAGGSVVVVRQRAATRIRPQGPQSRQQSASPAIAWWFDERGSKLTTTEIRRNEVKCPPPHNTTPTHHPHPTPNRAHPQPNLHETYENRFGSRADARILARRCATQQWSRCPKGSGRSVVPSR